MTTCVFVLLTNLISCVNVQPLTPAEAARVLQQSQRSIAVTPPLLRVPYQPPPPAPASRIEPLSRQWSTTTTWVPPYGPAVTWVDGVQQNVVPYGVTWPR